MKNIIKSIFNDRVSWGALLAVILFTGFIRFHRLDVPLERDEGEYAYAGQLILQGIPPYSEIYNMKVPGIYAAYALLLAVFGQTHQGIRTGLLIINAITTIIVFLLAKRIMNSLAGVISAASFSFLSISMYVMGIFANAEHFVILFATGGLFFIQRALESKKWYSFFTAGLLLSVSFTMKQHGLVFLAFGALYIFLYDLLIQHQVTWRNLLQKMLYFLGGTLLVICIMLSIMVLTGVFKNFWFWTVDYAQTYVSQVSFKQGIKLFSTWSVPIVASAPLLWFFIGSGFLSLMGKKISKHQKVFLILYALFSFFAICPGLYFRPHYFILLLPGMSLLAGFAINRLMEFLSKYSSKKIQYGIPILLIFIFLFHFIYKQRDYLFHMTPFQICRTTFWLNPFPESLEISNFIRKRTNPEDKIIILGSEPQIYFYSKRRSVSGYIYMYPMMEKHNLSLDMQKQFIKDIETNNPKYMVFVNIQTSWLNHPDSHQLIFEWTDDYQKRGLLKLVGVVELFKEQSLYYWEPEVKWPITAKYWIAVFERK
jgi:4-amino-4-deoxy-L-arabinose transferase-like glycosyltransferase